MYYTPSKANWVEIGMTLSDLDGAAEKYHQSQDCDLFPPLQRAWAEPCIVSCVLARVPYSGPCGKPIRFGAKKRRLSSHRPPTWKTVFNTACSIHNCLTSSPVYPNLKNQEILISFYSSHRSHHPATPHRFDVVTR